MVKRYRAAPLDILPIDRSADEPLNRQLYFAIREAILDGRLKPGMRLPASRSLARDLNLSRNTVVVAFDQLLAEGYVEGRTGAGTFVSATLPEDLLTIRAERMGRRGGTRTGGPRLSKRGASLSQMRPALPSRGEAFSSGLPELDLFPFDEWARLMSRHWRRPRREFLVGGDPAGFRPLREALAAYLAVARAVDCDPDQVVIVSGAQQALDLAARVLIDPGDQVWVEDPGYPGVRGSLMAAGARLVPVPLDEQGLDVAEGIRVAPDARLAFVTPSHQYPLGVTMSLTRRLELLQWARGADAVVLEDDYDSEYRYAGRPLAALQGLDDDGRVIYVGTMSKVMFPGLRLGYMVIPPDLVDAFLGVRRLIDSHPSSAAQAALAEFIDQGYLAAHIRRMRALYAERQAVLLSAARARLDGAMAIAPDESGMHLTGFLKGERRDGPLSRAAAAEGIDLSPLSQFYLSAPPRHGVLLGYAGVTERKIRSGIDVLARLLDVP